MLLQRGVAMNGKWSRSPGDVIRFVKKDGKEALMFPGITHILIVPNSPSFSSHLEYPQALASPNSGWRLNVRMIIFVSCRELLL